MATDVRIKEQLPELTERLLKTYCEVDSISHLGHCPLPNYETIIEMVEDLQGDALPGYRRREGLHLGNVHVPRGRLDRPPARSRSPGRSPGPCGTKPAATVGCGPAAARDFEALGQAKAVAFLRAAARAAATLAMDVQAAYDGDPACKSLDEVIFCYPGLEAVTIYRLAHLLHYLKVPLIPRMMTEWAHSRTGIDIHPGAKIGHHFFIDHGTGVVVGETCEIGNWVKLYQGVTLGALSFATDAERQPGPQHQAASYDRRQRGDLRQRHGVGRRTVIGHDSVIGSSVWLTRSVDPHTTVTMEKPNLRIRGEDCEFDPMI